MLIAGAFCVAFACGDEFHQSFVSGRTPAKKDIFIDSIGIFFGILVVRMVGWTGRMALFHSKEKPAPQQVYQSEGVPPSYPKHNQQRPTNFSYQEPQEQPYRPFQEQPPFRNSQQNSSFRQPKEESHFRQSQKTPAFHQSYTSSDNQEMPYHPHNNYFDRKNFDDHYVDYESEDDEYDDDDDPITGKPLRLFHYDDEYEYEEEESDEKKPRIPKLHSFSFKKHKS